MNGNGNPSQDQWNFGQNFVIHIIDNPVNIETRDLQPEDFVLHQNYPNPFNPSTNIGFRIADFGYVSLKVYDILGNEVATLVNEDLAPGEYKVEFFPESSIQQPASGIYLYQLKAGSLVDTKKMILLK